MSPLRTIAPGKGEKFPLFTSLTMEISAQCNRTCIFCPNHEFVRPKEFMPMDMITKAVDELRALKYGGRWSPYMYNEPLADARIFDICQLLRDRVPRAVININTNADYLTPAKLDRLIEVGVNQLIINIYSSKDGDPRPGVIAKGVERAQARAQEVQGWLDARPHIDQEGHLYHSMSPKKIRARVQHKYGVQKDGTNWDGGFKFQNRLGLVEWFDETKGKQYSGVCTRPFRIMETRWTGDVVMCCNDYNGEAKFGNIGKDSLVDIWNAMSLHRVRYELQQGIRTGICASCDYNGGTYKHMITHVQLTKRERAGA